MAATTHLGPVQRSGDDVVGRHQRMGRRRLRLAEDVDDAEGIDASAAQVAAVQELGQAALVHDLAARGVDEVGAALHAAESLAVSPGLR